MFKIANGKRKSESGSAYNEIALVRTYAALFRRVEEGSSLWRALSPHLRAAEFHWSGNNRERATANSFSSLNFCLGFDPTQFHFGLSANKASH